MPKPTHADAELLLRLYEIRREPELRAARTWFLTQFNPTGWAEIKARWLKHSDEDRWVRMTVSYWEMVGTLVNQGALHAGIFFDHTGEDVITWERCKPWIEGARADIRATYLLQFQRMVEAHLVHRAKGLAALEAEKAGAASGVTRKVVSRAASRRPARGRTR